MGKKRHTKHSECQRLQMKSGEFYSVDLCCSLLDLIPPRNICFFSSFLSSHCLRLSNSTQHVYVLCVWKRRNINFSDPRIFFFDVSSWRTEKDGKLWGIFVSFCPARLAKWSSIFISWKMKTSLNSMRTIKRQHFFSLLRSRSYYWSWTWIWMIFFLFSTVNSGKFWNILWR